MKKTLAITTFPVVIAILVWFFCPPPQINHYQPYSSAYLDQEGDLLRLTLAADERYRLYYPLSEISAQLIEATILYEDQGFYQHWGVDWTALLRAFWSTYVTGERRIGASTIAMQVARLKWGIKSNTIQGKVEQLLRALQLMRHHSHQEVLDIYLNLAPYGRNIEGVGAASRVYFNKTPDQLSLPEALTLAVIPQNPNRRNPTTSAGYDRLLVARRNLLSRWLDHHPDDANLAKYFDLPMRIRSPESLPFGAPHFVEFAARKKPKWDHGSVKTTLDSEKQRAIEKLVSQYVELRGREGIHNASVLLLNHQTMAIEAMVGSANYFRDDIFGQVNGTLAKRSPGSTLKPFVYALALDDGLVHPLTLLKDAPRRFAGFTPENFDKRFLGPISVKDALIQSRNVPAVDLQSRLKSKSFHQFLLDAGVSELKEEAFYGLALALGGGELSMFELTALYAALANRGELQPVRWQHSEAPSPSRRILSEESSYLVLDMLKDNPAPSRRSLSREVAWKTGTSWGFRDAWAIGISGPYVVAVWVGNFDGVGNRVFSGRHAAGPLMFSIFDAVSNEPDWQVADLIKERSLNLKRLRVCSASGDLYEPHCPQASEAWFIPGVSPIKLSNIYRQIPISVLTGLRACWHQPGATKMEVFEFWPSDYLRVFSQAGISLNTPPPFETGCDIDQRGGAGVPPTITSPQRSLEYIVNINDRETQRIPLEASVDSDVSQVYWFIDDAFVGTAMDGDPIFWAARPGIFEARVVDDSGRASSRRFVVSQVN